MTDAPETASPKITEDGIALHGDFPLNHRLRAEAIAKARRVTDPDEMVTREEIADAAERLKAERDEPAPAPAAPAQED